MVDGEHQQEFDELDQEGARLAQKLVEALASASFSHEALRFGHQLRARVRLVNEPVARDGAPRSKQKAHAQITKMSIQLHSSSRHDSCFRKSVVRLAIRVTTRCIGPSFACPQKTGLTRSFHDGGIDRGHVTGAAGFMRNFASRAQMARAPDGRPRTQLFVSSAIGYTSPNGGQPGFPSSRDRVRIGQ
jgi:hypothetical protein